MTDTDISAGSARTIAIALVTFLATLLVGLMATAPARANHTLDLTVTKTAGGTVTSGENPKEIDCGTDCAGSYRHTRVCEGEPGYEPICADFYGDARLTATPERGYRFVGWSGACSGTTPTCDLGMTVDRTVHAEFANSPPSITINFPADGAWLASSLHAGVTVTDDSGVEGRLRMEVDQRNEYGRWVRVNYADVFSTTSFYYYSFALAGLFADHPQGARLSVRACDAAGACSNASGIYGVDRVQPTFSDFVPAPNTTVGPGTQVWIFTASDATSGIRDGYPTCKIDSVAAQPCARNDKAGGWELRDAYTTSGTHNWTVTVRDRAGHERIERRSFTVDADPPETSITSGPADGSSSTDTTATFAFGAIPTDTGNTFRCRIYSAGGLTPAFGDCSGPGASHVTSGLPPGTYRFEVAARDPFGNTDPTAATRTFTVAAPATDGGGGGTGGGGTGSGDGSTGNTGSTNTGTATGATVTATVTQPTDTIAQPPAQQNVTTPPPTTKPGKCAKLKGKKRAACVRKACGKLKKKSAKKYRACVKAATRR